MHLLYYGKGILDSDKINNKTNKNTYIPIFFRENIYVPNCYLS